MQKKNVFINFWLENNNKTKAEYNNSFIFISFSIHDTLYSLFLDSPACARK